MPGQRGAGGATSVLTLDGQQRAAEEKGLKFAPGQRGAGGACLALEGARGNACPLYSVLYSKIGRGPRSQFGPRSVPGVNECSHEVVWVL